MSRDLGLALAELGRTSPPLAKRLGALALPLLESAVQAFPGDVPALEALGSTRWLLGRRAEALAAFDAALERTPRREEALTYAAALAAAERRADAADLWRRAIAVNPWVSQYHSHLARLLVEAGQWTEAAAECAAALQLNPSAEEARLLLIRCHLHTGREDRARAELETLIRLKPQDADALRRWFDSPAR